ETIEISCWNLLINLWDDDKIVSEICRYLKETKRVNENIYTASVRSLCVSGEYEKAYSLYQDMLSDNIKPHLRTFACFFGQNHNLQYEFFDKICLEIMRHKMIPTLDIFAKMIDSANRL